MTQKEVLGLLDKMTLTEKVGQLNQLGCSIYGITDDAHYANLIKEGRVGSFLTTMGAFNINQLQSYNMKQSRLGIPLLFCADIIHGVKTIFPTPLAESCSWDVSLARLTAQESAREASALGVRLTYAPMVDLARDARWGRVVEGSGEDVYLSTLFSMARVKGFQGDNKRIDCKHLGACAKHFVCYGNAIAGKDYNSADMNRNTFFNNYLPPFVSAINAGVVSIMTAFSTFEGIPCTVNKYLIRDILRKKLRFKGVIVSDYASIIETVNHRFVRSAREAVIESSMNTVDIDMADMVYQDYLEKLVVERVIPEQVLNDSVKRVLLLKYNLGLFDNPYTDNTREEHELYSAYALKLAKICAEKSIVLLKNKNNALPLPIKSKALIVGSCTVVGHIMTM
ncbi:MAG: glycoside hydrolase family 3 N-terminal domain-containing protein [Clostridia bacterium]